MYAFLKSKFPGDIRWNFATKFIVDREGQARARGGGAGGGRGGGALSDQSVSFGLC